MIASTQLRNGTTFLRNGEPYQVVKYDFIKMGRGGATVKVKIRNLITGATIEDSYSSNVSVEEVSMQKRKLQYLFNDGTEATFMDPRSYDQTVIPMEVLGTAVNFINEGELVDVLFWEDRALSVEIAPKVTLKVTQTDPGVKGNSATNIYKPAILENGLQTKVPLFIKVGDKIRVDTRTSEYIERA